MSFAEAREGTDVAVALRHKPNTGGHDPSELIRFAIGECSLGLNPRNGHGEGDCAILLGNNPCVLRRELQEHLKVAD